MAKTVADKEYSCGEPAAALQIANELLKTEKSEAIKEFAQRLKESLDWRTEPIDDYDIDDLVKEMTEENV